MSIVANLLFQLSRFLSTFVTVSHHSFGVACSTMSRALIRAIQTSTRARLGLPARHGAYVSRLTHPIPAPSSSRSVQYTQNVVVPGCIPLCLCYCSRHNTLHVLCMSRCGLNCPCVAHHVRATVLHASCGPTYSDRRRRPHHQHPLSIKMFSKHTVRNTVRLEVCWLAPRIGLDGIGMLSHRATCMSLPRTRVECNNPSCCMCGYGFFRVIPRTHTHTHTLSLSLCLCR